MTELDSFCLQFKSAANFWPDAVSGLQGLGISGSFP